MPPVFRRFAAAGLVLLLAATFATPSAVEAHASLVDSIPADGEEVAEPGPAEVTATFDEAIDPERSALELRDDAGETAAEGGVPADDVTATTMRLVPPSLAPGRYEVRWTAVTPDDDGVERGRFSFVVTESLATDRPSPTVPPSPEGSTTPPETSAAATDVVLPTPVPSASPAPTTPGGGTGSGDLLLPLLGLAAVLAAAAVFLLRRPRLPPGDR
jgi:LPXTG-motif cell wall-anchored protein